MRNGSRHQVLMLRKCLIVSFSAFFASTPSVVFAEGDANWVALCNSAQAANQQAQYGEAELLFERALKEARQFGEQSSRMAITMSGLAGVYQAEGKYSQAEDFYKRSIKIKEKTLGPNHPNLAVSYNNLAALYSKQGKTLQAIALMNKALTVMEMTHSKNSSQVVMLRSNISQMKSSQGGDELPELKATLAEREKKPDLNAPDLAQSLNNLGEWYRLHEQYAEAEPYYKRSLAVAERSLGKEHPYTCIAACNLGKLFMQEKKYDLAEPLLKQALYGREKTLGTAHPDSVSSLRDLADFYRSINSVELAQDYESRANKLNAFK